MPHAMLAPAAPAGTLRGARKDLLTTLEGLVQIMEHLDDAAHRRSALAGVKMILDGLLIRDASQFALLDMFVASCEDMTCHAERLAQLNRLRVKMLGPPVLGSCTSNAARGHPTTPDLRRLHHPRSSGGSV